MSGVLGIGVDLIDQRRIAAAWARHGERFARRVLHDDEWAQFADAPRPANALAKAWAAKEAVAKALGTGFRGMAYADVQLTRNAMGQPQITLVGNAAKRAQQLNAGPCLISLSDEAPYVIAYAVLTTGGANT
ncbi:holo-[acyl-carrier-protein] synthase [bacterium]|nr:holo-[acyl-carrier-protein] synthase [bacterium]